jgi:tRNA-Thr(GGU) m(6)t(6)A37 methyltransferase TsaA
MISPIATIHNDYTEKFGIPRQAGLVTELESRIVFEPPYRVPEALRGIEGFDYLWLIWQFSENIREQNDIDKDDIYVKDTNTLTWSPTVRPPRLGGNQRLGVFATRSPFRPNALGLSSVRLLRVQQNTTQGPILHIAGADLMNGTPIFDIKPYIPYTDAHIDARGGFADLPPQPKLTVLCPDDLLLSFEKSQRDGLMQLLALDPRPPYQHIDGREYGFKFAGREVRFCVQGDNLNVLTII